MRAAQYERQFHAKKHSPSRDTHLHLAPLQFLLGFSHFLLQHRLVVASTRGQFERRLEISDGVLELFLRQVGPGPCSESFEVGRVELEADGTIVDRRRIILQLQATGRAVGITPRLRDSVQAGNWTHSQVRGSSVRKESSTHRLVLGVEVDRLGVLLDSFLSSLLLESGVSRFLELFESSDALHQKTVVDVSREPSASALGLIPRNLNDVPSL